MRLFLYEYATAQPETVPLPASVRREGRAMFDALREDASKLADVEVMTLVATDAEERRFRETARRADVALVVAPEFDGILESRCRWAQEAGCRLLGPTPEGVHVTADKWELYRRWVDLGIPTPATWLPHDDMGASHFSPPARLAQGAMGARLLQKHRYGAASLGVAFVDRIEQVHAGRVLQQWVPGLPASIALLVTVNGTILPLLPARQLLSGDGSFTYLGGQLPLPEPYAARLRALGMKSVESLACRPPPHLLGYVGVDAVMGEAADGSQDYVLEINPRVTTSYVGLRHAASTNLIELMLRAAAGEPLPDIRWERLPLEFTADGRVSSG